MSTAATLPPSAMARDNKAVVTAALPVDADMPGYTRVPPGTSSFIRLCPTISKHFTAAEQVHDSAAWKQDNSSVYVITVLDPENAPADELIAELAPPECPKRDEGGTTFVHDRQPYERDGWTGELNTSLATPITGSGRYYVVSYLLSKGDAVVNVIADGTIDQTATFNPTVDEAAAHYVELVLNRFAA